MPVPRQQVADAFCRVIKHSCQDIGEPGLRIDVVELRGRDQRIDGSRPSAAFVGAGEGPVAAFNGTQLALGGVVRHAQAASSRKRVSAAQRLRLYSMALPVSLFLDTLARCSRNQLSRPMMSGRLRSVRTFTRCCGAEPLISRSMANSASMRVTASLAIGALLILAKSKNLRRAWAQQTASTIGPPLRPAS
jgi:hypothetical protein